MIESATNFNPEIKVHSTDKQSEALDILDTNDIGAFFIDIQLTDGNGIELAKEIRKRKNYQFTPIVFITGNRSKELEAFHNIHCYDYILKPYTRKTIAEIMSKIMIDYFSQVKDDSTYLNLDFKGLKQRVNLKDIIMVESRNRRIFIKTIYEEITYKHMNISQFIKGLPEQFLQVHQSIVINCDYLDKIDMHSNYVRLRGINESIPIGVSYKKKVGEVINGFL